MKKVTTLVALVAGITITTNAGAVLISGVDFPNGAISFADAVVDYSPGPDAAPNYDDPAAALGIPDWTGDNFTATSLGDFGSLTLQFTDNALIASGDNSLDLWVFEAGGAEDYNVQISTDNLTYVDLGNLTGSGGIDIDAVAGVTLGALYHYILFTDVLPGQSGTPFGEADIDAVGAISTAVVPIPAAAWLFGTALMGLVGISRRRKAS